MLKLVKNEGCPIEILQENINRCWLKTGIQRTILLNSGSEYHGMTRVEKTRNSYDIFTIERGQTTMIGRYSLDEATRWIVFEEAFEYALSKELDGRKSFCKTSPISHGLRDDGYSRWNWMALNIEIMQSISSDFGDWANKHYLDILDHAPLDDYEVENARWPLPQSFK
jgi:hypothetical protein